MAVRLIHVGVGARGRHWLDIVSRHPDFVSAAFVDPDEKARAAIRSLPGQERGNFFASLGEAVAHVQVDAALISSPSFLHAEHALQALDAGLAVMVEKPFGCRLQDVIPVVERARAVGRPVMVAENFRFFPAERTLRRMLDARIAGRIVSAICIDRRDQPSSTQGAWVKSLEYPFLTEIAVHHFDSFRYLFDHEPVAISARCYNPPGSDYPHGAAVEALIELAGGLTIQYTGTTVANRYEYALWLEGDQGDIWTDRKRVWWRRKGRRFFRPVKLAPVPKGDELPYPKAGTVSLLNQFRDAVVHRTAPETSGEDNLNTLAMVEASIRSDREGRRVRLDEVLPPRAEAAPPSGPTRFPGASPSRPDGSPDRARVLVLGLDAADAELIERWCGEGVLPNISRMRSGGAWARLQTTAEIAHVSAWPSIFTGTTPDKHGLYHAYVMKPGQQGPQRPRPDLSPFPFFWKLLSDHGKRCVVMDAFLTCPLEPFNGAQIVDWGSWSWFWKPTIAPAALKRELQDRFGSYPAEDHSKVGMTPPTDVQGFRDRLLAATSKKAEVVRWLMEREDWDFFLAVFGESHPAGHYFWHLHDPAYLAPLRERTERLEHALRDVYVALDDALGDILRSVDDRTTVFLVSGDGMGPNYSGSHILPDLLTRMGLLNNRGADPAIAATRESDEPRQGARTPGPRRVDILSTIRGLVPERLRIAVSTTLLPRPVRERLSLRWKTAGIAWDRTSAFLIENANEGYIRVNLRGREPEGVVEPGRDYERLCDEISGTARGMVNPANGKPAALTVYKTDDLYRGPCRADMPDVIIGWNDEARVTTELSTERYGVARSDAPGYALAPYYTGNHRPNAFMIALGPGVAPGSVIEGASILDLAPTILAGFAIAPPEYMDGRALSSTAMTDRRSGSRSTPHETGPGTVTPPSRA
jgi:predicted dehydrogenase/predicted AlkP superfamily phosphohydrolase/phosphomutase